MGGQCVHQPPAGRACVREEWRIIDRWWTDERVDRRYFEVVLESGQNMCVYRDRDRRCCGAGRPMMIARRHRAP